MNYVEPREEFLTYTREEVLKALESPEPSPIADEVARLIEGYAANFMEHIERLGRIPEKILLPTARWPIEGVAIDMVTQQIKEALDG